VRRRQPCGQRFDIRTCSRKTFGNDAQRHDNHSSVMGRLAEMKMIFIKINTT
jgi:hypothetical protein